MDFFFVLSLVLLEVTPFVPTYRQFTDSGLTACLVLFLAQYGVLKIYRVFVYPFYVSPLRHLPGPKDNHILFGQLVNLFKASSPNELQLAWMRQWPEAPFIRYLSVGNSEVVLVNSLAAYKEVLQTKCYSFTKPAFFRRLVSELAGTGLLFMDSAEHKKLRKQLSGPFSLPNVRKLLPVFQKKAGDLTWLLDRAIEDDPSKRSAKVEIEANYWKIALDIIGATALGVDLGNVKTSSFSLDFRECYRRMFHQPPLGQLITFVNAYLLPLRWLPVSANKRFVQASTQLREMLNAIIRTRMRDMAREKTADSETEEEKANRRGLLTFMLEENAAGNARWPEAEISDLLLQFIMAGHETITGALTWSTYEFVTNPSIQERLRKEILQAVGTRTDLDYSAIDNISYLDNFCHEVLRLYSPSVMSPREASLDMVIEGVTIPKGTTVVAHHMMIQRNPLVWGDDVEEFDPDRWNRLPPLAASPFAMAAFSNGPRICIGKSFAMLQFKVVLIEIIRNFAFEPADIKFEVDNPAISLKPKGGLRVEVRRLDASEVGRV